MGRDRYAMAEVGFAQGERYDRARPGYPGEAVTALCDALGINSGARVLDLAAGSGKLTRSLIAAGADVVAVEPVEGMRAVLEREVGVVALDGRAEAIPMATASVDAVTIGQAFHWFDGPRALGEIHRVLRPAGRVGLIWNVMDRSVPWIDALQTSIHRHRGDSPWYDGHGWRSTFHDDHRFSPLRHRSFVHEQPVDVAGVLERVESVSFIAALEAPVRAELIEEVRAVIPDAGGGLAIPYVTDVFWADALG